MQGTWVWSLVREDPTCHGATKPVSHNYWAWVLEPASHNHWACVPQLLKPTRLEPMICNKRSHCNEKPAYCNEDPLQPKNKLMNKFLKKEKGKREMDRRWYWQGLVLDWIWVGDQGPLRFLACPTWWLNDVPWWLNEGLGQLYQHRYYLLRNHWTQILSMHVNMMLIQKTFHCLLFSSDCDDSPPDLV